MPPFFGATLKSMTSSGSEEDHDNVSIPLMGTARWTGTTWEVVKTDAAGRPRAVRRASRPRTRTPAGSVATSWTRTSSIRARASCPASKATTKGKQQEGYRAEVKVSGESGDYNREQLGKMFMGAAHEGDATASGEWTLSAEVSPAVVRELEQNNKEMREAKTKEDKMRIYSKLVKERGAAMVGAQVGPGWRCDGLERRAEGRQELPRVTPDGLRSTPNAKSSCKA